MLVAIDLIAGGENALDRRWDALTAYRSGQHCFFQVVSGAGAVAVDGFWQELHPGYLYLLPGCHLHQRRTGGMVLRWLHLRLRPDGLDRRLAQVDRVVAWPLPRRAPADRAMARLCQGRLPSDLEDPRLLGDAATLARLLATLLARVPAPPALPEPVRLALVRIAHDATSRPSVAACARAAGVSVAHLHRLFHDHLGTTPARCLEDRRIETALALLADPSTTIAAVAAACGYADPFHFSRVLRRRLGASPSQLRGRTPSRGRAQLWRDRSQPSTATG